MRPSSRPRPSFRPDPLTATNKSGEVTSPTYDSHGNDTDVDDPLRYVTTLTYTAAGQVLTAVNGNDDPTTDLHDSQGAKRGKGRKRAGS